MSSCLITAYSPGDSEFVLRLSAQLKNRGFDVFLDITDSHALPDDQIAQLYQQASGLIAVLTREFLESSFGRAELATAARWGYPVFMIALRTVPVELLPRGMTLQGVLDFSGWRDERRFRAQLERLITAIMVQTGQRPRPPDSETCYLNDLIARLEAQKSTVEFEPINRAIQNSRLSADRRPLSKLGTLWGVNSRLRLIVPPTETSSRVVLPTQTLGEALAQVHRAVLIGEPGCGTSSTMKRLALDIAYENRRQIAAQSAQARFPLPVVIDLAWIEPEQSIREYIRALWGRYQMQTDPLELLRMGGALLMLDGLDEPGASGELRAAELRAWLASDDAPSYLVVTSRSDQVARFDLGLAQIECLPMNEAGMRRLIEAALGDHAHDLLSKADQVELLPAAIKTLPAHLLTLIHLYKHEPAHELPSSIGRLYRRLIASLWTAHADSGDPIRISSQELSRPLSALAIAILDGRVPQALPRADAIRIMQGETLVDEAVRSGILSMSAGRVRFASRWLLDAFAALHLTPADVIPRLMNARVDELGRRIGSAWDQALILYAGMSAVPDVVVREIAEVDPLLASQCIDSGVR
ncbi:MAG: TIR domain-containing protein, partial [Anaerolinea sp.]|nr:TIR domain-containing protein [Anaerolinea sp.]